MSLPLRSSATASAFACAVDQPGQTLDRERITRDAETAQARLGHRGDMRMMAEALTREDVADVDLDHGHRDRSDRVANGDRGVGIGAGIDDDPGGLAGAGLMDQVDDLALVVRLAEFELEPVAGGGVT